MMFSHVSSRLMATAALGAMLISALPAAAKEKAAPAPAAESAAKPELGTFGFDTAGMDTSVQPGDDFYAYANGTWAKNTQIPADKSNYGMFTALADLSQTRTREILDAAKGDPNSMIGRNYAAYIDSAAVEAKGLAPIQPWLNKIRAVDKPGLATLLAEADRNGVQHFFGGFVGTIESDEPRVPSGVAGAATAASRSARSAEAEPGSTGSTSTSTRR